MSSRLIKIYFRGKPLCSDQNHHAYRKWAGRHLSKEATHTIQPPASHIIHPNVISSIPALLPLLIAHATKFLPTSSLFLEAARSADALDESDLPRWEEDPPYMDSEPDSTLQEERFTQNLIDVMLG
ncbi:hypothetical protein M404DRAFT_170382 [Pisolithus tinctorius Marx 270]|uniref:Uncharacterized protein n=1 Tax=Pisolithus tinctorius Marx 270 TaxID=870435 RepID=A0A0C3MXV8_PISTI|nr:hypothetical protein M404DRAFT_170382 [Pisolithus tinctorius Marx 270]